MAAGFNERVELDPELELELYLGLELRRPKHGLWPLEQRVAQLFVLLREPVYRYLVAVYGRPAEAEEITQEAFLRLYRCLHHGQRVNNARSWIFRVAHNLALDQQKGRKHLAPLDRPAWHQLALAREEPALNPELRLLQQEQFARLQVALAQLGPQEQQCLHLRAEGFRYREIAEILGIGASTVTDALRRGINQVQRLLQ